MTRAITVLLDEQDFEGLSRRAEGLGVNPGVAARELIHAAVEHASPRTAPGRGPGLRGGRPFKISTPGSAVSNPLVTTNPLVTRVERVRAQSAREHNLRARSRAGTGATQARTIS